LSVYCEFTTPGFLVPKIGLTHNLGGPPSMNVCSFAIIGAHGA